MEERHYLQHDANYNVTAVTDRYGTVVERYLYDPYGLAAVLDANWGNDADGQSDVGWLYLHQGGRYDATAGLYHFRNRDYSPTPGRWTRRARRARNMGISWRARFSAGARGPGALVLWLGHSSSASIHRSACRSALTYASSGL